MLLRIQAEDEEGGVGEAGLGACSQRRSGEER